MTSVAEYRLFRQMKDDAVLDETARIICFGSRSKEVGEAAAKLVASALAYTADETGLFSKRLSFVRKLLGMERSWEDDRVSPYFCLLKPIRTGEVWDETTREWFKKLNARPEARTVKRHSEWLEFPLSVRAKSLEFAKLRTRQIAAYPGDLAFSAALSAHFGEIGFDGCSGKSPEER